MAQYGLEEVTRPLEDLYRITYTRKQIKEGEVIMPKEVYVIAENVQQILEQASSLVDTFIDAKYLDNVEIKRVTHRLKRIVKIEE